MMSPKKCLYVSLLVCAFFLLSTPAFSDEEDDLLQGLNSFRQSRNLVALSKNDNANCVADEIADAVENKPCSSMAVPSIITSTQPRYANYPDIIKKCNIDINTTADGVIWPVCVPKRVTTLVLTNYTQSSYASYLNNSRYSGIGIGKEDDWVVVVLTTTTPACGCTMLRPCELGTGPSDVVLVWYYLVISGSLIVADVKCCVPLN